MGVAAENVPLSLYVIVPADRFAAKIRVVRNPVVKFIKLLLKSKA